MQNPPHTTEIKRKELTVMINIKLMIMTGTVVTTETNIVMHTGAVRETRIVIDMVKQEKRSMTNTEIDMMREPMRIEGMTEAKRGENWKILTAGKKSIS